MRELTYEVKETIEVKVNLHYYYDTTQEAQRDLEKMADILENYGLHPKITDGKHYGPCKTFTCRGYVTLREAEDIVSCLHDVPTHASIEYFDSRFSLVA